MTTEDLKKLYDKILCIADELDDVIKESFNTEPQEGNVIYRNLNGAWYKLDAAMDKIYFEIHSQEERERRAKSCKKETFETETPEEMKRG